MNYYQAHLRIKAKLIAFPNEKAEGNQVTIRVNHARGEKILCWLLNRARIKQAKNELRLGFYALGIWPRTDKHGKLSGSEKDPNTHVITMKQIEPKEEVQTHGKIVGRLVKINETKGLIDVVVHPNEAARLKRAFQLTLKADKLLLESCKCIPEGVGVEISCHVDDAGYLCAESAKVCEVPKIVEKKTEANKVRKPPAKRKRVNSNVARV